MRSSQLLEVCIISPFLDIAPVSSIYRIRQISNVFLKKLKKRREDEEFFFGWEKGKKSMRVSFCRKMLLDMEDGDGDMREDKQLENVLLRFTRLSSDLNKILLRDYSQLFFLLLSLRKQVVIILT